MDIVAPSQQVMEAALELRSVRARLLAQNVANADTPGYMARDVDFKSAINAMLAQDGAQASGQDAVLTLQNMRFDRNDVDLNQQMAKVDDNGLAYVATLKLYGDSMGRLQTALSNS
jgi:flagellar basal-body rod protein FlgB